VLPELLNFVAKITVNLYVTDSEVGRRGA